MSLSSPMDMPLHTHTFRRRTPTVATRPGPGLCQCPYTRFDDPRCPDMAAPTSKYCCRPAVWGVTGYGYLCNRHYDILLDAHPEIPVEAIHRLSDDDEKFEVVGRGKDDVDKGG